VAHDVDDGLLHLDDGAPTRVEELSGAGGANVPSKPVEERSLEVVLERLDVLADRRLGQAETLGGATLWIRAASRAPLPDGHYYHDALIGCAVETVAGAAVGQVTRIDAFGSAPLLVVTDGRHEVLIPLAEAICVRIDPAARRIVIDPPEGLLEANL